MAREDKLKVLGNELAKVLQRIEQGKKEAGIPDLEKEAKARRQEILEGMLERKVTKLVGAGKTYDIIQYPRKAGPKQNDDFLIGYFKFCKDKGVKLKEDKMLHYYKEYKSNLTSTEPALRIVNIANKKRKENGEAKGVKRKRETRVVGEDGSVIDQRLNEM